MFIFMQVGILILVRDGFISCVVILKDLAIHFV